LTRRRQDVDAAAPSVAAGTAAGIAAARGGSKKKWDEAAETQVICQVCVFSVLDACCFKRSSFQAVKAAEEEKNKVREQRKRAAQEEILRLEQVPALVCYVLTSLIPCINSFVRRQQQPS
jgi:hypothetical protein